MKTKQDAMYMSSQETGTEMSKLSLQTLGVRAAFLTEE